jgi:hypothetical protein
MATADALHEMIPARRSEGKPPLREAARVLRAAGPPPFRLPYWRVNRAQRGVPSWIPRLAFSGLSHGAEVASRVVSLQGSGLVRPTDAGDGVLGRSDPMGSVGTHEVSQVGAVYEVDGEPFAKMRVAD